MPIRSFRSRALRRLYESDDARGLRPDWADRIRRILFALDEAAEIDEMARFPGWRLHPLRGHRRGFWSVSVTGNWRIVFRFKSGDAFDVDLVDYH